MQRRSFMQGLLACLAIGGVAKANVAPPQWIYFTLTEDMIPSHINDPDRLVTREAGQRGIAFYSERDGKYIVVAAGCPA